MPRRRGVSGQDQISTENVSDRFATEILETHVELGDTILIVATSRSALCVEFVVGCPARAFYFTG